MIKFVDFDKEDFLRPLQVKVEGSFEYAFRQFKAEVQKERIITLYKQKMAFEKPSIKKRRKRKENAERQMQAEMRDKLIKSGEWDRRQRAKDAKKQVKLENRLREKESTDYDLF